MVAVQIHLAGRLVDLQHRGELAGTRPEELRAEVSTMHLAEQCAVRRNGTWRVHGQTPFTRVFRWLQEGLSELLKLLDGGAFQAINSLAYERELVVVADTRSKYTCLPATAARVGGMRFTTCRSLAARIAFARALLEVRDDRGHKIVGGVGVLGKDLLRHEKVFSGQRGAQRPIAIGRRRQTVEYGVSE